MQKNNLQQWKDSVSYGQRWIAETVFSSIKRMFGEYVTAIRFENMIKEIMLKASLYNLFQSITIRQIKENKDRLFKRVMQQSTIY